MPFIATSLPLTFPVCTRCPASLTKSARSEKAREMTVSNPSVGLKFSTRPPPPQHFSASIRSAPVAEIWLFYDCFRSTPHAIQGAPKPEEFPANPRHCRRRQYAVPRCMAESPGYRANAGSALFPAHVRREIMHPVPLLNQREILQQLEFGFHAEAENLGRRFRQQAASPDSCAFLFFLTGKTTLHMHQQ